MTEKNVMIQAVEGKDNKPIRDTFVSEKTSIGKDFTRRTAGSQLS
ncbi:hypothetical protein [Paenibacillus sp. 2TAB19]